MKKTIQLFAIALLLVACRETNHPKPILLVENPLIEMGTIRFDSAYHLEYVLKNTGKANLEIDTVTSSCGCSEAYLTRRTLAPSDTVILSVTYRPVDTGPFNKSLVVKSNTDSMFNLLLFKGTVVK